MTWLLYAEDHLVCRVIFSSVRQSAYSCHPHHSERNLYRVRFHHGSSTWDTSGVPVPFVPVGQPTYCCHPDPSCKPFPTFPIAISYPQEPCTRSPQGINSLPVAANSATGFGDPDKLGAAAPHTIAGAFFASAASCHGGCARETFGFAGFQVPGSPTCVQLPPIVWRQCVVVPT